jgi:hypothetical protein
VAEIQLYSLLGSRGRGNVLVLTHPIGNIPTLCQKEISRQNCTTGNIPTQKRLSGYFLLGNRKYPDTSFANRKCPDSKKHCRDISCWAIGNVPTAYLLSGHFLLPNRKYPDRVAVSIAVYVLKEHTLQSKNSVPIVEID